MKKFALISLIMLMAVSAFGQATGKTGYKNSGEKEKKEAVKKDTDKKTEKVVPDKSSDRKSSNSGNVSNRRSTSEDGNSNSNRNSNSNSNRRSTVHDNSGDNPNNGNSDNRNNSNSNRRVNDKQENGSDRSSGNTGRSNDEYRNTNSGNDDRRDNVDSRDRNSEDKYKPSNNNPNTNPADGNRRYIYKTDQDRTGGRVSYSSNHTRYDNRTENNYAYHYRPEPIEVRREKYPIRQPRFVQIYWTNDMLWEYRNWYPEYRYWNYPIGYRLMTISAYDAYNYIGEVARVYGKVEEVFYSSMSDEYYLYIGAWFPYQDLCIVLPGNVARRYSHRPTYYFNHSHISVTGFITEFDGKPEILVKRTGQLDRYYR